MEDGLKAYSIKMALKWIKLIMPSFPLNSLPYICVT